LYLIPYHKTTLYTLLSSDEVIERLNKFIQPHKSLWKRIKTRDFGHGNYLFNGKITGKTFQVERIINYRNSFLPEIKGNVVEDKIGTQINLVLKLKKIVYIFDVIWLAGLLLMSYFILYNFFISDKTDFKWLLLVLVMMILWKYLMTIFFYSKEAEKSLNLLKQLFEAKEARS